MTLIFPSKRELIRWAGAMATGIAVPAVLLRRAAAKEKGTGEKLKEMATGHKEEEVTPPEDLMREHGVLDRVLLVYEAAMRKYSASEDFDPAVVTHSAGIVRDFIHNYHEESEEQHVFPRFKQAGKMVDLIDVLLAQHKAGKGVTERILQLAPTSRSNAEDRKQLLTSMQSFITMYRPHAAREDTELFPKLKDVVSSSEYDAMAEDFEKKEHQLFGEDGFEKMTAQVAQLEQQIGIYDLNQFTPR